MLKLLGDNFVVQAAITGVACLAWLVCLVMSYMRYRAFKQRKDLWWTLSFLCLLATGLGRAWEAWQWHVGITGGLYGAGVVQMGELVGQTQLQFAGFFMVAGLLAIFAMLRRTDDFD